MKFVAVALLISVINAGVRAGVLDKIEAAHLLHKGLHPSHGRLHHEHHGEHPTLWHHLGSKQVPHHPAHAKPVLPHLVGVKVSLQYPILLNHMLHRLLFSHHAAGHHAHPTHGMHPSFPHHGLPSHGWPHHEPASHGWPHHGSPSHGWPHHGLPSHGWPHHGPPSHGPSSHGWPHHGPPSHGWPHHGPPSHGSPHHEPIFLIPYLNPEKKESFMEDSHDGHSHHHHHLPRF